MDVENVFISSDESTFQYDENLPSLPVPPINKTLKKYLDSVKPFVNDEEYKHTEQLVSEFKNGIGRVLHFNLQLRAKKMPNWLEAWWEKYAYLMTRQPLIPCSNFSGTMRMDSPLEFKPETLGQTTKAAWLTYYSLRFWNLIRKEKLKPDKSRGKPWTMSQYRKLFSTYRIPGEVCDQLKVNFVTEKEGPPNSNYIIALCNGHIFKVQVLDSQYESYTVPELELLFENVKSRSFNQPGQAISSLTCDERTRWAKNRKYLIDMHSNNKEALAIIENAITFVVLDAFAPDNENELVHNGIGGDTKNRWADSFNNIIFRNGASLGNADHTPFDGLVAVVYDYFTTLNLIKSRGVWKGTKHIRDIASPTEITFKLDLHLESAIETAITTSKSLIDQVIIYRSTYNEFGKHFLISNKMNPDTFVQECLQLAYYRTHNKPASTYETASTRGFYNGRTETVRSCTTEAIMWANSMLDSSSTKEQRKYLLELAMAKHEILMAEGKRNEGCDRHLLGLLILCLETGKPIPEIFNDPSWVKSGGGGNFVLSTSLNGYMPCVGCVTAMITDGYGVFYSILPTQIHFNITTWKTSNETDADRLYAAIEKSFNEMQALYISASSL